MNSYGKETKAISLCSRLDSHKIIATTFLHMARVTTAVLSWHVQKFVAIWWPVIELPQGKISIEFELRPKYR